MTDISIVIVNYNVREFLHQCLISIEKSLGNLSVDVWIVDNNSVDGSKKYLQSISHKPDINVILNDENVGFSTANNQAIHKCDSKYVMLLNPDTVLEENTLKKCFRKMEQDKSIGALGVRMIDGAGKFLPESKRGFPSLWASFTKMSGMSKLAPKSKWLNGYYCGHIDEFEEAEIDVLCGAIMFIRSSILDEVGLLDETFFMYGEDIDLSYRIQKAGVKVYYYPDTSIIHYKGESTKKTSLTYLRTFYNAMIIFINKHFKGGSYVILIGILKLAIYFRASISWMINWAKKLLHPVLDMVLFGFSLIGLKEVWAQFYFKDPSYFDDSPVYYNFMSYIALWVLSMYIMGSYDRKSDLIKLIKGLFLGLIVILVMYGLLPMGFRSSRVLILLGFPIVMGVSMLTKLIANYLRQHKWDFTIPVNKNICIIGHKKDCAQVESQLRMVNLQDRVKAKISIDSVSDDYYVNDISNLAEVVKLFKINEIIFSSSSIPYREIFEWMRKLGPKYSYKIASQDQDAIIGSSSKNETGEVYTYQFEMAILDAVNIRLKRIFDLIIGLISLLLSPVIWIVTKADFIVFSNIINVLIGNKTWIGYDDQGTSDIKLPQIRNAIFNISDIVNDGIMNSNKVDRINLDYARNYTVSRDVESLLKAIIKYFTKG